MIYYFLYFIIYAFIGWTIEVIRTFILEKKLVNRGFLIGPICPIYGYGFLIIILLVGNNTKDLLSVFLKIILACSILEYFTSYFMEKIFKARWWDYSSKKFNINGRICLETMIPFGILGISVIYIIHPFINKILYSLNPNLITLIAIIFFIAYLIDNIISFNVMNKIKIQINNHNTDNTELIKEKISEWLNNNSILYRHIKNSYPKFKIYKYLKK